MAPATLQADSLPQGARRPFSRRYSIIGSCQRMTTHSAGAPDVLAPPRGRSNQPRAIQDSSFISPRDPPGALSAS